MQPLCVHRTHWTNKSLLTGPAILTRTSFCCGLNCHCIDELVSALKRIFSTLSGFLSICSIFSLASTDFAVPPKPVACICDKPQGTLPLAINFFISHGTTIGSNIELVNVTPTINQRFCLGQGMLFSFPSVSSPLSLSLKSPTQSNLNPLTPKSDQYQISPAASPEILPRTVWRTWLFIAYSDARWLYYQLSLPSVIKFSLQGWENAVFELGSERVNLWPHLLPELAPNPRQKCGRLEFAFGWQPWKSGTKYRTLLNLAHPTPFVPGNRVCTEAPPRMRSPQPPLLAI